MELPFSIPVLAAIVAVVLVAMLFALRRGGPRDLIRPPPGLGRDGRARSAPPPSMRAAVLPADVEAEVLALLGAGRKIDAIKLVRAATGLGLGEAKDLVERM